MKFIIKYFNEIPKKCSLIQFQIKFMNVIFNQFFSYTSSLYLAVQKENIDIIKLLLDKEGIDVNLPSISRYLLF